jgi:hypothetical protein
MSREAVLTSNARSILESVLNQKRANAPTTLAGLIDNEHLVQDDIRPDLPQEPSSLRASAWLLKTAGALIVLSTFPGILASSYHFHASYFPWWLRSVIGALLIVLGRLLYQKSEAARQLFLVIFPLSAIGVAAGYPRLLWYHDLPYAVFAIVVYAPLVWLLTRAKTISMFRPLPCNWINRGGFTIACAFLLTLLLLLVPETILTDVFGNDTEAHVVYSVSLEVLLLFYVAGMLAVGIPTRCIRTPTSKVPALDYLAGIGTLVFLASIMAFRMYRPDLGTAQALSSTVHVPALGAARVLKYGVTGFFEQETTYLLEHPSANVVDILKKAGYVPETPNPYIEPYWIWTAAKSLQEFADSPSLIVLAGGKPPEWITGSDWYHFAVISSGGKYSMHRVIRWALP